MDWSKIRHFKQHEFLCKCCGREQMDQRFVERLDALRSSCMIPLVVHSGWRCEKHDAEVNGSGNHPTGHAADIRCLASATRYKILRNAIVMFSRIGQGETFIHVDDSPDKPPKVFWLY